jgi:hypothetical protein
MINTVMGHLNLLVKVEAGDQLLPSFCLLTLDLPAMSLKRERVIVGSATPLSTSTSTVKPRTRQSHSPIPTARLQLIQEGILQHSLKCQDVQAHLNRERQRLHGVSLKFGLRTNLWTAIFLQIPVLLLDASPVCSFLMYDCFPDQQKKQTIDLTAPKDCKDPETDYYPVRMTELKIIMTDGYRTIMATQCLVLKGQEVFCCGGHPSFHYGLAKIVINQPAKVTPQECRDALTTGQITVQGQKMDFKVWTSHFHWYYTEGDRADNGKCSITTFRRKVVTYEKSYEETTIKILISKVRGIKLGNTIKLPSRLIAPHSDGVVRDVLHGMLIWSTEELPGTDMMSLMYQGRSKLHQAKSNVMDNLEEDIILVEQNKTRRYKPCLGGHEELVQPCLPQHTDPKCGCVLRDRGPQQGLEIPESLRPREGQSPNPHALPSPQPRFRELQTV